MASAYPPYMNATGLVTKILTKILEAKTPDRFTQDFLGTVLGFGSGSAMAFIPFAKRIGLINSDGTPSDIYKSFRNPGTSKGAAAIALKKGFGQLYEKNEYVHSLSKDKLEGLVIEVTGLAKGHPTVRSICGSFDALKSFADFNAVPIATKIPKDDSTDDDPADDEQGKGNGEYVPVKMGLSITPLLVS